MKCETYKNKIKECWDKENKKIIIIDEKTGKKVELNYINRFYIEEYIIDGYEWGIFYDTYESDNVVMDIVVEDTNIGMFFKYIIITSKKDGTKKSFESYDKAYEYILRGDVKWIHLKLELDGGDEKWLWSVS